MKHQTGTGRLQHHGGAWGHAQPTGAPKHLIGRQAKNTLDQAKGSPPDGGQTKGQHQVGRKGPRGD